MPVPRKFHPFCLVLIPIFVTFLLCGPALGEDLPSRDDLRDVVNLMEDPRKREAFIEDLNKVIKAREALKAEVPEKPEKEVAEKEKEIIFVENLFFRFETLSRKIVKSGKATLSLAREAPNGFSRAKVFLSRPGNKGKLLTLFINILSAVAAGVIVNRILKRYLSKRPSSGQGFLSRLARNIGNVVMKIIPYGFIPAVLLILFHLFPTFHRGQSMVLILSVILLAYKTAFHLSHLFVNPEDGQARILPIGDENANYYWVWFTRLLNYTALYWIITSTMLFAGIPALPLAFVRNFLLIGFPLSLTIFIMQLAREIRFRYRRPPEGEKRKEGQSNVFSGKFLPFLVRYWPVLGIAYTWAFFIFLILRFDRGFQYLFSGTLWTAATVLALIIGFHILDWIFNKFFTLNEKVKQRFPGLEERTNRYIFFLKACFRYALIAIGLGLVAQLWGLPISTLITSETGSQVILRAVAIFITTIVVIGVMEISQLIGQYILKEEKRGIKREISQKTKTLVPMITAAIKVAAIFIGGIVILDRFGVNTGPILAGAGIVGLAVGFGAQTLVKDLINGLFILFEESIRVGDWVAIGGKDGMVESVGLRTVRLRDVRGNVHVIPNSAIESMTNYTKEFSRTLMDIGIAYREDVDVVIAILKEIGEQMENDPEYGPNILEPLEIFGLDRFEDSAVIVRTRFVTRPMKQWGIRREFYRRMKKVFDERGIEIPFPHRTLYMGEPKTGAAPPLEIRVAGKNHTQGKDGETG